jgi:hypothetical protein
LPVKIGLGVPTFSGENGGSLPERVGMALPEIPEDEESGGEVPVVCDLSMTDRPCI